MHDNGTERRTAVDPGQVDPLSTLMVRCLPDLRTFVRLRVGPAIRSREESGDLVQSVCRELLSGKREVPTDESQFRRWLFVAAERKIVDHARHWAADRRDAAREIPLGVEPATAAAPSSSCASSITPLRTAVAREEMARLERALAELQEEYRDVIVYHRLLAMSHADIAKHLGRTEGAVRNLLYRGLARLTELVARD